MATRWTTSGPVNAAGPVVRPDAEVAVAWDSLPECRRRLAEVLAERDTLSLQVNRLRDQITSLQAELREIAAERQREASIRRQRWATLPEALRRTVRRALHRAVVRT